MEKIACGIEITDGNVAEGDSTVVIKREDYVRKMDDLLKFKEYTVIRKWVWLTCQTLIRRKSPDL